MWAGWYGRRVCALGTHVLSRVSTAAHVPWFQMPVLSAVLYLIDSMYFNPPQYFISIPIVKFIPTQQ
jgi:hypothetical protein